MRVLRFVSLVIVVTATVIGTTPEIDGQTRRSTRPAARRASAAPTANSFDGIVKQASTQFQRGNYDAAAALARKATVLKPEDYRPQNILAHSLFKLNSFEAALSSAQTAKQNAPDEIKPEIDELISSITNAKAGDDEVKRAERAVSANDSRGAAEAYKEAFRLMPNREDLGLKAAQIYNDQVKNYSEAISVVNQIILKTRDAEISAQAKDLLGIAEENLERDKAERERKAAEERRREEERAERERRAAAEREREQRIALARDKVKELESRRDDLQQEMESAQQTAEDEQGRAENFDQEAARYDGMQYGQVSAGIARIAAQRYRNSANKYRAKARDLQNQIGQLDREIARLQRDMY